MANPGPNVYVGPTYLYYANPFLLNKNTQVRIYNKTTGKFVRTWDIEGYIKGFESNVKMEGNWPVSQGIAAGCDVFAIYDEERQWNRLQAINAANGEMWRTEEWNANV